MSAKWWIATATATVGVVATVVAGVLVTVNQKLEYAPAATLEAPQRSITPLEPAGEPDTAALAATLDSLNTEALGTFGAQVIDTDTGEVVWSNNPGQPLRPASATKVLTAAAALLSLGAEDRIETDFYQRPDGALVVKAAGDVWFTEQRLDAVANQVAAAYEGEPVTGVFVDTTAWEVDPFSEGWDPQDVDGGFIAPMEAIMLNGGRIGATTGDVPRSHAPALDVARQLAGKLGTSTFGYTGATPTEDLKKVATSTSPRLEERLQQMMEDSDNVAAEAIGREMDPVDPANGTLDVLRDFEFDVEGVSILDNSGLSVKNVVTAELLADIFYRAATEEALRPLIATLPVAGGTGTLAPRFEGMAGRGWVRAKTGTLTDTSALAGVAVSKSGRVYAFGFLSNDSEILGARAALDALASALREA